MFVSGRPFLPILMFASKAEPYPTLKVLHFDGLRSYFETLDEAGMAFQEQTL